jgi:ankyrin repeat protein
VDNHTALAEAIYSGNPSTVYLLLANGAAPNSVLGPDGSVPKLLIDFNPTPNVVAIRKLLIQYGLKMPAGS